MQRPLVFTLTCLGLLQTAQATELATYRALYRLTPSQIIKSTATEPLDGTIAYEMRGSECMGYKVSTKFSSSFAEGDNGIKVVDLIATTTENINGKNYDVEQHQLVNGSSVDVAELQAKREKITAPIEVRQSGNKNAQFNLAANILFPTAHQQRLLQLAAQGKMRDVSAVYDGTDGAKVFDVVTLISKRRAPKTYAPDLQNPASATFINLSSWVFQLGYYAHGSKADDLPEFQSTYNMYENGVATELLFTYDTYQLKGKLITFEVLPQEPCKAVTP